MMEKHDNELTPDQLDHDALVSAMGHALRSVSLRLIACVGATEAWTALFAEAISCAQIDMTPDQIAVLLRGMADRIEAGHLDQSIQ